MPVHARTFGKYTLLAKLATGGMAEIFLARMKGVAGFEKQVVIKKILPQFADDEQFVAMFLDEARIAARISHPNVCQVYELGEVEGQFFLAMEYLEGIPLTTVLRKITRDGKPPDLRLVTALVVQACEGLHSAHELKEVDGRSAGVIHRDVSPQNLFVTIDGTVKVLDFGIAKAAGASAKTRTGTVKGKYAYMSPEQLRGETLDRRSDVFALGIVLFESMTGRRLFHRETDYLIFKAITDETIPSPKEVRADLPAPLVAACNRALARARDDRPSTARMLGQLIVKAMEPNGGVMSHVAIAEFVEETFAEELNKVRERITAALTASSYSGNDTASLPKVDLPSAVLARRAPTPTPTPPAPPGPPAPPSPPPASAKAPPAPTPRAAATEAPRRTLAPSTPAPSRKPTPRPADLGAALPMSPRTTPPTSTPAATPPPAAAAPSRPPSSPGSPLAFEAPLPPEVDDRSTELWADGARPWETGSSSTPPGEDGPTLSTSDGRLPSDVKALLEDNSTDRAPVPDVMALLPQSPPAEPKAPPLSMLEAPTPTGSVMVGIKSAERPSRRLVLLVGAGVGLLLAGLLLLALHQFAAPADEPAAPEPVPLLASPMAPSPSEGSPAAAPDTPAAAAAEPSATPAAPAEPPAEAGPAPPSTTPGTAEEPRDTRKTREPRRPPKGPPGTITIDSTPYATIYVDGRKVGDTPLVGLSLPPGRRSFKAVSEGRTKTFTVTIEPGKEAPARRLTW